MLAGTKPVDDDQNFGLTAAFYEGARNEIIARIGLRDQALSLYLTAASLIASLVASVYAFGKADTASSTSALMSVTSYLLLIVPLLSYAVALVVSQHNTLIGATEAYLATEFEPAVQALGVRIPQWDTSSTMVETKLYSIRARTRSHRVVITLPALLFILVFGLLQMLADPSLLLKATIDIAHAVAGAFMSLLSGHWISSSSATVGIFDQKHVSAWLAIFCALGALWFFARARQAISSSDRIRRRYAEQLVERSLHIAPAHSVDTTEPTRNTA